MNEQRRASVGHDFSPQSDDLPGWDLSDLYPALDSDELNADLARAEQDANRLKQQCHGKVAAIAEQDPAQLAAAVRAYEDLQDLMGKLMSYASLLYAADTSDLARAKFHSDIQDALTAIGARILFFELEINRLDDAVIEAALRHDALSHYRPWLNDIRKEKPYQLEENIEKLFLEKSVTASASWNRLFDETIANMNFTCGEDRLSIESALSRLQDRDPTMRREAARGLAEGLGSQARLFALITNVLAKDRSISDRWRGFSDIADARHLANRVEADVVDALERAVVSAYPRLSHRYYQLKARWLGVSQLNFWDRNAPLPDEDPRKFSWGEARDIVLTAYGRFSPQMRALAESFFERKWIDAPLRPGKAPGAFSHPTVPSVHPYILLNYQGKPRDVMTLAHELGHGVHQCLAGPMGALMAPTPLTLAETASVFGEMLTFRALVDGAPSAKHRRILLAQKVEDMLNTVVRQIAFYRFERRVHLARRDGELTISEIQKHWLDIQKESLGPAVQLNPGYEHFWSYIPHFVHSPFYVYAYAFGDCLVNSLYAVYQRAESGFSDRYTEMLAAGGSKHHRELLAPFGLDASDPDFWNMGLNVISDMVDELEE